MQGLPITMRQMQGPDYLPAEAPAPWPLPAMLWNEEPSEVSPVNVEDQINISYAAHFQYSAARSLLDD
jgi:hypothetical protein